MEVDRGTMQPDGRIVYIEVTNGGSGYTAAPPVGLKSSTGSSATATAKLFNDSVGEVVRTNPGKNYEEILQSPSQEDPVQEQQQLPTLLVTVTQL